MNSSYVRNSVEYPPFSRRDLYVIFSAGVVSAGIGLLLAYPLPPTLNYAPLLNPVDTVSKTFATGLFFFLTAGILFSSQSSRQYLLGQFSKNRDKRVFLTRVLHCVLITGLFTTAATLIAFLYPIVLGSASQYTISFSHVVYLPSVLAASLFVSIFFAILASSLAVITDDSRLCVALGSVSTLMIALVAGWSSTPYAHRFSLTRNIALLSPHNVVRALAVQLSGYQFESSTDMVRYVGFVVSVEGLAIALLILGSISIVPIFAGQRVLSKNSFRWPALERMIPAIELWDASDSPEKLQKSNRIRRSLRLQRGLTTAFVSILILSMCGGYLMYTDYVVNSTTMIHYTTPGIRENIPVGSWIVFDVEVHPPFSGLFNQLFFDCHIETMGNTSGTVSFFVGILEMNSVEFNLLEESIRFGLLSSWLNQSSGVGFGTGEYLEESYGSFVCALKLISDDAPSENSYVEGTMLIVQEAY
ncbi:MAG: hypothetical protein ACFFE6_01570 [Candidatus Thorarchaeota archaeon]